MLLFRAAPCLDRVAPIQAPRDLPEFFLNNRELPQRDREKALRVQFDSVFELEFPFEPLSPQSKRRLRAGRHVGLEVSR